ncbi:hypothetical protein M5K25_019864 [Dendrobium thyrsiflorum]|uniref:Uncharacterized protein n=1 Tax=Dendrobium thyrsiflorum TaxID=117978 RepID=A0ABD0UGT3_DENTH
MGSNHDRNLMVSFGGKTTQLEGLGHNCLPVVPFDKITGIRIYHSSSAICLYMRLCCVDCMLLAITRRWTTMRITSAHMRDATSATKILCILQATVHVVGRLPLLVSVTTSIYKWIECGGLRSSGGCRYRERETTVEAGLRLWKRRIGIVKVSSSASGLVGSVDCSRGRDWKIQQAGSLAQVFDCRHKVRSAGVKAQLLCSLRFYCSSCAFTVDIEKSERKIAKQRDMQYLHDFGGRLSHAEVNKCLFGRPWALVSEVKRMSTIVSLGNGASFGIERGYLSANFTVELWH